MSRFVSGEVTNSGKASGPIYWHKVDEAGPDESFKSKFEGTIFYKTVCGNHYASNVSDKITSMFKPCPHCQ